ncbi:MAG TPA: hypothetical protein PLG21_20095 [Anaerolineae bacterium]|nr:hypothetical protein [Anaerolineae bacterium]
MKIYLMARYGRRLEMLAIAAELERMGHQVTSRWIRGEHELQDELLNTDPKFRDEQGAMFAKDDLEDLLAANCAIAFTEEPGVKHGRGRGGRHFEAGVAYTLLHYTDPELALGPDRLICCGHKENVFMCLPDWEHYPDWPTCLAALLEECVPTTPAHQPALL